MFKYHLIKNANLAITWCSDMSTSKALKKKIMYVTKNGGSTTYEALYVETLPPSYLSTISTCVTLTWLTRVKLYNKKGCINPVLRLHLSRFLFFLWVLFYKGLKGWKKHQLQCVTPFRLCPGWECRSSLLVITATQTCFATCALLNW